MLLKRMILFLSLSMLGQVAFADTTKYTVDPEICPTTTQKILVIDLKSGWWAGDGGDFGHHLMEAWKAACKGRISFEYRHRTYGNGNYGGGNGGFGGFGNNTTVSEPEDDGKFPEDPWDSYSQIWLLSGGEADSVDLRIETRLWKRYEKGISGSNANIFIGGGFGNVYHANALTSALGLGSMFIADREAHEYPTPSAGVHCTRHLFAGENLSEHPLFDGVDKLVGNLMVGQYEMVSDHLATSSGINIVATNVLDNPVIGVVEKGKRRMIFDAGLHRSYGILAGEVGTLRYLQNIAIQLSR